jgi:hypothetical protein
MSDVRLLMGERAKTFRTLRSSVDLFSGLREGDDFSLRAPRISAISAFKKAFSAQRSQRYAEHRTEENPTGKARVQVKIDGAETSKRLRSDLPLI